MDKSVDILLATYNGQKYLREQLDSILNQEYKNFNLIISDDFSTDSTRDILKEYENKDERIKVIYQEKNIGSNANFEFLLTQVQSEYYMFSDQDDVWKRDKVRLSIEAIENHGVDLVYTDLEVVDENLKIINNSFNRKMRLIRKQRRYQDYRLEYLYNCVTGCTMICRTSKLKDILPFPNDKNILHDYWIALITSLNGKIYYLDIPTIKYRQHIGNQVGTKRYTQRYETFDEKRDYIIDLKIDKFSRYLENSKCFTSELNELSKNGLSYFENIRTKKYVNFKGWKIYNKIFKYETFGYKTFYFFFYNFPFIYRVGYNFYRIFKK